MTLYQTPTGFAIVCGGRVAKPVAKCWEDGCERRGWFQCDEPIGLPVGLDPSEQGYCDRPMCVHHRVNRGVETDYCREHVPQC